MVDISLSLRTDFIWQIDSDVTAENVPFMTTVAIPHDRICLRDFKSAASGFHQPGDKFFFSAADEDLGLIRQEISADSSPLPSVGGKVVGWINGGPSSCQSLGGKVNKQSASFNFAWMSDYRPIDHLFNFGRLKKTVTVRPLRTTSIDDLPGDCLRRIFLATSIRVRIVRIAAVCRRWRNLVGFEDISELCVFDLWGRLVHPPNWAVSIHPTLAFVLPRTGVKLKRIDFSETSVIAENFQLIRQYCSQPIVLDLYRSRFEHLKSAEFVSQLAGLPQLEELSLGGTLCNEGLIERLRTFASRCWPVKRLRLSGFNTAPLPTFNCPQLVELVVYNCRVDGQLFERRFRRSPNLCRLRLSGDPFEQKKPLEWRTWPPCLTHLELSYVIVSAVDLEAIAHWCPQLTEVSLAAVCVSGLAGLRQLGSLRKLELISCRLDNRTLGAIAEFPSLEEFNFDMDLISLSLQKLRSYDAGVVAVLEGCQRLRSFKLIRIPLSCRAFQALAGCETLRSASLFDCFQESSVDDCIGQLIAQRRLTGLRVPLRLTTAYRTKREVEQQLAELNVDIVCGSK